MAELFWLSDRHRQAIARLLSRLGGKPQVDDRRVISGISDCFRERLRWCAVPAEYGRRTTLFDRFSRWSRHGLWRELFAALAGCDNPFEIAMIYSAVVHAHRSAAGAKGRKHDQAIGECRGGSDDLTWGRNDAALTEEDMSSTTTFATAAIETVHVYPQQSAYSMPRVDPSNQDTVLQNIGSTALTLVFSTQPPNMNLIGLTGAILVPPGCHILLTTKTLSLSAMATNKWMIGGPHAQAAANAKSFTALSDRLSTTLVVARGTLWNTASTASPTVSSRDTSQVTAVAP